MTTRNIPSSPPGSPRTSFGQSDAEGGVTQQAREAGQQARDTAQQVANQARGRVRQQVDDRTTQLGDQLASTARDVRSIGEELRKQGKEAPARVADEVAARAERIADYMKSSDADRMLSDVEDIARQRPWLIIAGGVTLGFLASRFLKASSSERYSSSQSGIGGAEDVPSYEASYDAPVAPVSPGVDTGPAVEAASSGVWEQETDGDLVREQATRSRLQAES